MKRKSFKMISFLLIVLSLSVNAQQKVKVSTSDSKINWSGKNPAREHKGYIKLSGGELIIDNKEVKGGSFVMDMKTITDVDLADDKSNNKLVGHLKSPDFFDVKKFPTAKFTITKIMELDHSNNNGTKKSTHRIEGDLTMKGVTKKVSFDASISLFNGKFAATTPPFTINRTEWGVNYQSKSVFAGLKDEFIYDDVTLVIDLVSE